MIVYVLKVRVDRFIIEPWVKWMQEEYIPKAMESEHFSKCQIFNLHQDKRRGQTFVLQLWSKSDEDLDHFLDNEEIPLLERQKDLFRGRYAIDKTFLDYLEEINE